ncbi:MAG: 4Fe-4S dicluster domain-containing protein [Myxococcota bacterium]
MARLCSILNLAWRLVLHFLALPFRRRASHERRFLDNYAADRLLPAPAEIRPRLPSFERCIACGLCNALCETLATAPRHRFGGPAHLARAARSFPDLGAFRAHVEHEAASCGEACRACEAVCPTAVPLRELARHVRAEAARLARR